MRALVGLVLAPLLPVAVAGPAHAGWVVEWRNVQIRPSGERVDAGTATMKIADGKVRLEQPQVVTVLDYRRRRFTLMNPERKVYWSGTLREYAAALEGRRAKKPRRRVRPAKGEKGKRSAAVKKRSYPEVKVLRTDKVETVAGHATRKYVAFTPERTFQEMWIAEDLDLSKDLPPGDVLAYQRQMSETMLGKSGEEFGGLYRSEEYAKVLERGVALRTLTHHIAGGFERTATSVRRAEIDDGEFRVPRDYRPVPLDEVLEDQGG